MSTKSVKNLLHEISSLVEPEQGFVELTNDEASELSGGENNGCPASPGDTNNACPVSNNGCPQSK